VSPEAHYPRMWKYDSECFDRTRKEHDAMRSAMQIAKTATGPGSGGKVDALVAQTRAGFFKAMDDDLNTPDACIDCSNSPKASGRFGVSHRRKAARSSSLSGVREGARLFSDLT